MKKCDECEMRIEEEKYGMCEECNEAKTEYDGNRENFLTEEDNQT
jgi:hypothetical protein